MDNKLKIFKEEVESELLNNILPFWSIKAIDKENGGYLGRIDGTGKVHPLADKGSVLNARILWTFSAAFRIFHNPDYLLQAVRAKDYILNYFVDKDFGGVYWQLNFKGKVLDSKKQIYAQAFTLYALAEYYRATSDESALKQAIEFYKLIEKYSFDPKLGGYFEAFGRDWSEIEDLRLSDKDANEKKTMNTHLHILEAYTNLLRIWKDDGLKQQLQKLIELFITKIVNNKTDHLNLFFTENWEDRTNLISYGHDIECSWLLLEAAEVLGNQELIQKVKSICISIANASCEGLQADGSLIYEYFISKNHFDTDRHWWVQAEAVVGLFNAYVVSGNAGFLNKSLSVWSFISSHIIDKQNGEWYWSVNDKMIPNVENDKTGFWKCPYHNSRMCFEIIERLS